MPPDTPTPTSTAASSPDHPCAPDLIERTTPDVVLTDPGMPGLDGIVATRRILARHPDIGSLLLTTHEDDDMVRPRRSVRRVVSSSSRSRPREPVEVCDGRHGQQAILHSQRASSASLTGERTQPQATAA
jgi:DNA-binding NarL/FixJ family response regulator